MGTEADKLSYLVDTKTAIKNAIKSKGVDVDNAVTFRQYAEKIGGIEGGGGIPEYMMYAIVDEGTTSIPNMSADKNWFKSKVYIPPSVTEVGGYLVTKSAITEVLGGENILTVGTSAFLDCRSLTSVSLPLATVFGSGFCYGCISLIDANLPSVINFAANAFSGCTSLINIDLGSRNNVLMLSGSSMHLRSEYLTVDSFLQVGNALVDNTGSNTRTIIVKSVAWDRLSTAQKEIFTDKNYTISVS